MSRYWNVHETAKRKGPERVSDALYNDPVYFLAPSALESIKLANAA